MRSIRRTRRNRRELTPAELAQVAGGPTKPPTIGE
jgi:hypothetical protein